VAREGGTICIAPEGNRTYSGRTEYMNPTIAPLAKKLKLPIALCRLEGGYGVQPRWSDGTRKGRMRCYVAEVIEPEDAAAMTNEALYERIQKGLFVDEAVSDGLFQSQKRAEYLERAMYVCPHCGLSEFESSGDVIVCKKCERQIRYLPSTALQGINCDFPFPFVAQWYDYQEQFINALDLSPYADTPLYRDSVKMWEVIPYQNKLPVEESVQLRLYGDRIEVGSEEAPRFVFPFADTGTVTVLGKNKINLYYGDKLYQFWGSERFNALRYVNIFHHHLNCKEGAEHSTFLGI
jgi:hypothetical protein